VQEKPLVERQAEMSATRKSPATFLLKFPLRPDRVKRKMRQVGRRKKAIAIFGFIPLLVWWIGGFVYTYPSLLGVSSLLGEKISALYQPEATRSSRSDLLLNDDYELALAEAASRWSPDRSSAAASPYYHGTSALRELIDRHAEDYSRPPNRYIMPVVGIHRTSLVSSFGDPRPGGRTHQGIDIFAGRGTEVVSATDGVVLRVGYNHLGGNAVLVLGEGLTIYYYAHLDSYVPDLRAGQRVYAGQVIGYVGNTGNASSTTTHLHFGMYQVNREFWPMTFRNGAVDPFLFLTERGKTIERGIRLRTVSS
jgi:murein DD-endopeptidase MepM/ murein hydrolase activator NlpD